MRKFDHIDALEFSQASKLLKSTENATAIAGGTDLIGVMKDAILTDSPDLVVNLKSIEGADKIEIKDDCISIGVLTRLCDIEDSKKLKEIMPILCEGAKSVATPIIRNSATIGGNICQDVRCWYYRFPHYSGGRMECLRKGGKECYAVCGKNQYHSAFGGIKVHDTGCTEGCPAQTDIPAYLEKLRNGDIDSAARIIMQVNPIPAITSRVCAHFCQEGCRRELIDENVGIGSIERHVGDYILENANTYYRPANRNSGKRVAIVGSGPAGLSAAYYLRKEGHEVTIIEKQEKAGGLLQYAIPAYRLPKNIVDDTVHAIENMGVEFRLKTEIGGDISPSELESQFDKVFYDVGAWKRSIIGLDGEELTVFGLEFLMEVKNWMKGKLGSDVLVIGGGNVSMDVAVTAKRLGAANVTLVALEKREEMPAESEEIERALEEGVVILNSYGPKNVLKEGNKLKGLELKKCLSVFDEKKKFDPKYDENDALNLHADSILMAIGQKVDLSFLDEDYQLELNRGLIKVNEETKMTSKNGVYAGGDVTSGPSTVIAAVVSGRMAAVSINNAFGEQKEHAHCNETPLEPPLLLFDPGAAAHSTAVKPVMRPAEARSIDKEDNLGITAEQAIEEAKRCFNCGCVSAYPSDMGVVLFALDAIIKTTKRNIRAADFFGKTPLINEILEKGELITEIEIGRCDDYEVHYEKFRMRKSGDFAIASIATAFKIVDGKIKDARIVIGGASPVPIRLRKVEAFIEDKVITSELAYSAGDLAVEAALPLEGSGYKIQEMKILVYNAVLNAK